MVSSRKPDFCTASTNEARPIIVTGTPERASRPPKYPPTAPAPTTATFGQLISVVILGLSCSKDSSSSGKVTLKVIPQIAKDRQNHQLSRTRQHWLMLQLPGIHVRDVHGVEARFHRRVDVAARAIADHPALRLHDFMFVNQQMIGLGV